jgi:hypothetical protein
MSESNLERARRIVDDIFRDVWERGHISEKDLLAIKDVARIAVESALDEAEARGAQAERTKVQRLVAACYWTSAAGIERCTRCGLRRGQPHLECPVGAALAEYEAQEAATWTTLAPRETLTCAVCGASETRTSLARFDQDWDWFRGWFARRLEICPACNGTAAHNKLVKESQSNEAQAEFYRRHPKKQRKQP